MSSVIRFVPRHLRTSKEGMAAWLYGASERVRAASDREFARTGFPTTGRRFRLHDTAQRMRDVADWLLSPVVIPFRLVALAVTRGLDKE